MATHTEFHTGQVVPFPASPGGVAQVEDLLRTNVQLLYLRGGRLCRRRVPASELAEICRREPALPLGDNVFARGVLKRSKAYPTTTKERRHARDSVEV